MRSLLLHCRMGIACLALVLAWPGTAAAAKSVDAYLHGSAAKYIQGRLQEAGVEVEEGLRHHPNDPRLKSLAEQLRKMKDQKKQDQGGESQKGGDQNKDKQDKQDSDGQGNQDGKQDQKDQEKDKEEEKKDESGDKDKDKDKGEGENPQDQKPQPEKGKDGDSTGGQDAAPAKPGQMSKEEAERLLNSYQDDEKREQKNQRRRKARPEEIEKDW